HARGAPRLDAGRGDRVGDDAPGAHPHLDAGQARGRRPRTKTRAAGDRGNRRHRERARAAAQPGRGENVTARGLIIAAPHSGAGKTTATLAVLAALRHRSVRVRAAKAGPDYIDPAFHAAVTGAASVNLDSWAMPGDLLDALAAQAARDADLVVIEGVMGLFDGATGPEGRRGATADLAAHFRLPVVLVIDVAGEGRAGGGP